VLRLPVVPITRHYRQPDVRLEFGALLRRSLLPCLFTACAAHAADHFPAEQLAADESAYRQAIADARAGRSQQAAAELAPLVERNPARQDLLGDYGVVLGWAGQDSAAIDLLPRIDLPAAPAYVVQGLANSARHLRRYELAESLCRNALVRAPEQAEPQICLARTLIDAGKPDPAAQIVGHLRAQFPKRIDVLELQADFAASRRDYFGTLSAYQAILAEEPERRSALRGKVMTLQRLGTPRLGLEIADRTPGLLSPAERAAMLADGTAHEIRSGIIAADTGRGPGRFAGLDRALAESDAAGAHALDRNWQLSAAERQLVLDRVTALSQRYRMRDAVDLYEAMAARPEPVPAYVKEAAASAYLYLEQPEKARDLYREALVADPKNPSARLGLFYALAESEDHKGALAEVERLIADTPERIDAWSAATLRDNPVYIQALDARAMAPLFANRPGEAEQRLRALAERAPYNLDIRTDHASAMRARGWPRAAVEELGGIVAADPNRSGALGELAGARLEMRDYQGAASTLAEAQAAAADDGRVVRATRLAQVHGMRELIVDGTFGKSSGGGPIGTRDYALDALLYSEPLNNNYRAFGHLYSAQSQFDTGTARRDRAGIGLEYRSTLIVASGELAHGQRDSKTAAALSLAVTPNDQWTISGAYESSSNQTPLQATLAGIDARRAAIGAVWRASESRNAGVSYGQMNFSDGNRRETVQGHWTERLIAGPVYRLTATAAYYTSQNSRAGTAYFNPSRDSAPTLEVTNEWLQWRRYTRSFRHRVVLTVGEYRQQGFGSGPLTDARYEQEWAANDTLVLRYGVGRSKQPYDGVQIARNYGYFYLNWRF